MKTTAIRNLTLGALCASFIGAAAFASAGDWRDHGFRDRVIVRERPAFGLSLGVVIGAPVCVQPVYCPPVVVRDVVIHDRYDRRHWR